jgi:hydroxyacylglutathione hydrolase
VKRRGPAVFLERVESKGLAHYSYMAGDSGCAVVIDPRRDCAVYLDKARSEGVRITNVLETHRNEDYITGAVELSARCGADLWHADGQWEYSYGTAVRDGQTWKIGGLTLRAIHSPGHTPGSVSYLLSDGQNVPWALFSGDTLFAGDVGRVDLVGIERTEEMAALLYDTIFDKFLPLGDHVIVCPAHGAGSVCGNAISERIWTTIGLERLHNPKLLHTDKGAFISAVAKVLERPPYFRRAEVWNLEGPPSIADLPVPFPMTPSDFERITKEGVILDTRTELSFAAGHVPGSLSIWLAGLPSFGGWFLPYDRPLFLVGEADDPTEALTYLTRLGYDRVAGYLAGGMHAWHMAGRMSSSVETVTVQSLCHILDQKAPVWILDVRATEEVEEQAVPNSSHIHVTQLPGRLHEVPEDCPVFIFCGSGLRSMIAASLLKRAGRRDVKVVLGGLSGWNAVTCPLE